MIQKLLGRPTPRGPSVSGADQRRVLSIEHSKDGLVLFDVPPILVVVLRNRHGADAASVLLPKTRTGYSFSRRLHPGRAQVLGFHTHPPYDAVELGGIPG